MTGSGRWKHGVKTGGFYNENDLLPGVPLTELKTYSQAGLCQRRGEVTPLAAMLWSPA